MSVQYKLYKLNDNINDAPREGLIPRVISRGTFDTEKIATLMSGASSLTKGDIYGVIVGLKEMIIELIHQGYNVKIDELGTFSISAESRIVQSEKEIRADSIRFKRVVFKPARKLSDKFKNVQFVRYQEKK